MNVKSRNAVTVNEAKHRIQQRFQRETVRSTPLLHANGRVMVDDVMADHDVPSFDRAAMDGFAVQTADLEQASFEQPMRLLEMGSIAAGDEVQMSLGQGQCMRIMTGSPVPEGADAVVMIELTEQIKEKDESWIQFTRPVQGGLNIARRGEDVRQGYVFPFRGRQIKAGEMTMLSTYGYDQVRVYKQPVVGVLPTGSELLDITSPLQHGKIRNSNSYMLHSQIEQTGAIAMHFPILADDLKQSLHAVHQALDKVPYLITTGGASVGDYDFMPEILHQMDATVLFDKVAMRPGSVTTVAKKDDKWIFVLSGNPSACFVGFELFVAPVLRYAQGYAHPFALAHKAYLAHDIHSPRRVERFMRATAIIRDGQVVVGMSGKDKSGISSSLVNANVLLHIPAKCTYNQGEKVSIYPVYPWQSLDFLTQEGGLNGGE